MDKILKKYCIVILGNVSEVTETLSEISETDVAYVSGSGLLIATFETTFSLVEIEGVFNDLEKSYIIFEMTPGFFSANIKDKKFQDTLFGGPVDNVDFYNQINDVTNYFIERIDGSENFDVEEIHIDSFEHDFPEKIFKKETPIPDMDEILDRISEVGYDNLTEREKKLLKKYSQEK